MEGSSEIEAFEPAPGSFDGLAKAVSEGRTAMVCAGPRLDGRARAVGFLDVRGWAYSRAGIDGVFVYLDGLRYQCRHGLPREDLAGLFSDDLTRSGFELTIELDTQQAGRLSLAVVAQPSDGAAVGVRGEVECRPAQALESPGPRPDKLAAPAEREQALSRVENESRYHWATEVVREREVLDAACGTGHGTAALAAAGAGRAVGVDIAEQAILDAREQFGAAAQFEIGDLHELPFAPGSFDVAICFETLAHVRDPDRALDELRRVLRADGLLLVSVPNAAQYPPGNPAHLQEFQRGELEQALGERFANVRLYGQQAHIVSLIADDAAPARGAEERDLSARVRRLAHSDPGEGLYTVVAASDASPPDMSTLALIGGPLEEREWHDLAWARQERVLIAEAEASASEADAHAARLECTRSFELVRRAEDGRRRAERALEAHEASLSWRVTRSLRSGKRALRRARAAYRRLPRRRASS